MPSKSQLRLHWFARSLYTMKPQVIWHGRTIRSFAIRHEDVLCPFVPQSGCHTARSTSWTLSHDAQSSSVAFVHIQNGLVENVIVVIGRDGGRSESARLAVFHLNGVYEGRDSATPFIP